MVSLHCQICCFKSWILTGCLIQIVIVVVVVVIVVVVVVVVVVVIWLFTVT